MKINSKIVAILIVVVIFGGILLSSALGFWHVDNISKGNGNNATEGENFIRGNTTYSTLLTYGLEKKQIDEILGGSVKDENRLVKDICIERNLEFFDIKTKLNELLSKK